MSDVGIGWYGMIDLALDVKKRNLNSAKFGAGMLKESSFGRLPLLPQERNGAEDV